MSLAEVLVVGFVWLDANATAILSYVSAFPVLGTIAAYLGKGGRTENDGRMIANCVVGAAVVLFVVSMGCLALAKLVFDQSITQINIALLAAPVICLVGSLVGIHAVFPLNELASIRSLVDVLLFVGAAGLVLTALSYFRGWGVLFRGGLLDLAVIGVITFFLLRGLYRRAFAKR